MPMPSDRFQSLRHASTQLILSHIITPQIRRVRGSAYLPLEAFVLSTETLIPTILNKSGYGVVGTEKRIQSRAEIPELRISDVF